MIQIILEDIELPETSFDKYACWEELRTQQVDMISGRRVVEIMGERFKIWKARWSCDYLDNETTRKILAVLRRGGPFYATVLPDNREEMVTSSFLAESVTNPTFLIDDGGEPVWRGLGFALREEEPHA